MTNKPASDIVWQQLGDELRRFIRRRVADEHAADDLLQETFLRIHRGLEMLADSERLSAWVYRIARNVIHDHYRRTAEPIHEFGDRDPPARDEDPRSQLPLHAGVWLEELIHHLPETYRDAVRLSEIDGLSQQEVADRLGLSLSAAKSRVQRGRVLLRDILDRCCTFEFDRRGNLVDYDPRPDRTVCRDCE